MTENTHVQNRIDELKKRIEQYEQSILIQRESPCPKCHGSGTIAYPSTSVWMGGPGGMQVTQGICDECWGSGETSWQGTNLRKVQSTIRELKKLSDFAKEVLEFWESYDPRTAKVPFYSAVCEIVRKYDLEKIPSADGTKNQEVKSSCQQEGTH